MPTFGLPEHPGSISAAKSAEMARAKRRDTKPELALRRELHRRGLRYRVCFPVPGAPRRSIDIAFTRAKLAVFVDGCYWHGCPEHRSTPSRNSDWWLNKFRANKARDADTDELLNAAGWTVLRFWEHTAPADAAQVIQRKLADSRVTHKPRLRRVRE